ncbi:7TM diverse intracellular signaling domain-containing protein [Bernardetia sp. Wsw4-3y2]|uniref:7TM diverse intracellular signaling domain-containing protein n=1 Tax=Bernardetia sp. Wsw4-3y2 TaxID=3127471 RepID=UPI0030CB66B4
MKFYLSSFYKIFLFFLPIFFCCVPTTIFAQTIVLEDEKEISSLASSLSYYVEGQNENYTIQEVSSQSFNQKWLQNPAEHLNLGYNSKVIWLKIEIENQSKQEDWNLILDLPYIDSIYFYEPVIKSDTKVENNTSNSKRKIIQTGWHYPYNTRTNLESNGFVFPLYLSQNQSGIYYLRTQSTNPVLFPISITKQKQAIQQSQDNHIGYGIYFGILLVICLYNLIIFIMVRDISYLYYVASIVFTFLIFGGVSGYLFKYIYPNYPEVNVYLVRLAMIGIVYATGLFVLKFLEVKKYSVLFYRYFLFIFVLAFVALILDFSGYSSSINNIVKLHSFSLLVVGIYCWVKGNKVAYIYTFAWIGYTTGGLMITLRNSGSLPINFWTTHGAEIGSALEVVLLSIALAERYRIMKREKEIATKKALALEQRTTQELEEKVNERTLKLNESNEELAQINEELSINIETVEKQKTEIESKNQDITASINYAKRIQDAILPSQSSIQSAFTDSFTLYLPKDVVSGDFYFFFKNPKHIFLAVADCTGHGVPGSLMAMIGTNLLRESIVEKQMILPSEILMNLHEEIVSTLKQKETGNRDGMDISLCVINKMENKIYFSGAKNPLISIKNEEITEHKGSRFSIGGSIKTEGINFEDKIIEIDNQTSYYMYSDGYQDQFGGESNKKFMRKNLKNLLQTIHKLPFQEQNNILETTLSKWKEIAQAPQIDDILVMGFKI